MISRISISRRMTALLVSYGCRFVSRSEALVLADDFAGSIFRLADGRAHVAFSLLGATFGFEVAIAGRLADGLLHRSGRLLRGAGDALLVHNLGSSFTYCPGRTAFALPKFRSAGPVSLPRSPPTSARRAPRAGGQDASSAGLSHGASRRRAGTRR